MSHEKLYKKKKSRVFAINTDFTFTNNACYLRIVFKFLSQASPRDEVI